MKPDLRIYYDGKLDIKQTYAPVVKKKIFKLGNEFNDWFVGLYN